MFLDSYKKKYFLFGIINTIFGYSFSLLIYYSLSHLLNIILIGLIINYVSITFAFINYKIFVFKTSGNWIKEYLKCFTVYGGVSLLNLFLLWLLVEIFIIPFWIVQFFLIFITFISSYIGHSRFTFSDKFGSN